MWSESVETITSSMKFTLLAAEILHSIKGLPAQSIIFLFGKPFEPALAGISANKLKFLYMFRYFLEINLNDAIRNRPINSLSSEGPPKYQDPSMIRMISSEPPPNHLAYRHPTKVHASGRLPCAWLVFVDAQTGRACRSGYPQARRSARTDRGHRRPH